MEVILLVGGVLACMLLAGPFPQASAAAVNLCTPDPTEGKVHYIIGYGSLMNTESKQKTSPETGLNIPVRVLGYERSWTARGLSNSSLSTTYLGVTKNPGSFLNGVIYTVPSSKALGNYDAREKYYCRARVPLEDVSVLKGIYSDNGTFPTEEELKNSEFWIYVTKPEYLGVNPDEEYPIVQSYLDTFLGGCIQLEEMYGMANYSDQCIETTKGWDSPLVNDRLFPRRPFVCEKDAGKIDKLLDKHFSGYPENTYIEKIRMGSVASQFVSKSAGTRLGKQSFLLVVVGVFLVLMGIF